MKQSRHVIKKLKPHRHLLDDQIWPAQVVFVLLGVLTAGALIVGTLLSADGDIRHVVPAVCAIIAIDTLVYWLLARTSRETARPVTLFSLGLSLIVHLALLVVSMGIFWHTEKPREVVVAVEQQRPQERIEEKPEQEWHVEMAPERTPDWSAPVDTAMAKPVEAQPTREKVTPTETPERPRESVTSVSEPRVTPSQIVKQTADAVVPHRATEASRLARQMVKMEKMAAQPADAPAARPTNNNQRRSPEELTAAVSRQRNERTPEKAADPQQVPDATSVSQARANRRAVDRTEPQESPQVAQLTRTTSRQPESQSTPVKLPRSEQQADSPQRATPTELTASVEPQKTSPSVRPSEAATAAAAPQQTSTPQAIVRRRQIDQPTPTAQQVADSERPRERRPITGPTVTASNADVPRLAKAPTNTTSRNNASRIVSRSVATQRQSVAPTTPSQAVQSSAAQLPQQSVPSESLTRVRQESSNQQRALTPTERPSPTPRRTTRSAAVAQSPLSAPLLAAAPSERATDAPRLAPAKSALARSRGGVAGSGRSANLDSQLPAPQRVAMVASGAARRQRATQATEAGPALAPNEQSARLPRKASPQPASSRLAITVEKTGVVGGARQAEQVDASSSAAMTRQASNAAPDSLTAAAGSTEIDLGPTQVVSERGSGKASGGGQPTVASLTESRRPTRRQSGGRPIVAIVVPQTANVAVQAPGKGAGSVGSPSTTPTGSAPMIESTVSVARSSPGAADNHSPSDMGATAAEVGLTAAVAGGPQNARTRSQAAGSTPPDVEAGPVQLVQVGRRRSGRAASRPTPATGIAAAGGTASVSGTPGSAASAVQQAVSLASGSSGAGSSNRANSPFAAASALSRAGSGVGRRSGASGDKGPEGDDDSQPLGGLVADVPAPIGAAGLGRRQARDAGIDSRLAARTGAELQVTASRFPRRRSSSPVTAETRITIAAEAFSKRALRKSNPSGSGSAAPLPKTEQAIELGLRFLAQQQQADGSWSLNTFGGSGLGHSTETAQLRSRTAATGMSLLAFLGAGYHHQDDKYQNIVADGVGFLVDGQASDGNLYQSEDAASNRSAQFYSHGIASIALCEAYGMTQDPALREPAQRAINYIAASQQPRRGGWRYRPGTDSDTSVTGWLLMALKSGQLAGLEVPLKVFQGIDRWLDLAQVSESQPHLYCYTPFAPNTPAKRHGRRESQTMTAVGLLMRLYLGWNRETDAMQKGGDYLLGRLPEIGGPRERKRDTYYWYYATQVMFHLGGDYWDRWNTRLHGLLTESQIQQGPLAGSWDPLYPVADRWGSQAGRLYVTALNLLSLEVTYRHLPIYEETSK